MNKEENTSNWGFVSADGFFQPISSLNTENLEYAYKSLDELQLLLQEKVQLELYEQCAVIRDEISKRAVQ